MRLGWDRLRRVAAGCAAALLSLAADGQTAPLLKVVAAESVYGDVARQLGGSEISVVSILSNPNQDAHLFEPSPSVARAIATADLVVYNGADYDPWMVRLLATGGSAGRRTIVAAGLMPPDPVGNPHLWYRPGVMPVLARAMVADFQARDPAHRADYAMRLEIFLASLKPLEDKVADIRARYAGQPIAATEPIFGPMAEALGLRMENAGFQLAIMNETEPSARDLGAFEADLRQHRVKVLIYNRQTTGNLPERLIRIAGEAGIPVVAVTESLPPGETYQQWIMAQLQALASALAQAAR